MSFRIIDIDPHNSPEEMLFKYIDFFEKIHLEQSHKDPLPSKDIFIKRLKVENVGQDRIINAVLSEKNDELIAILSMRCYTEESYEYEKNKHIVETEINVLKEFKDSEL